MKRFLLVFILLFSVDSFGQNTEPKKSNLLVKSGYTFLIPQFDGNSKVGMGQYGMPTVSVGYLLTDSLSLEVFMGIPSAISIYNNALGQSAKIASFVALSPNATLQYYFSPKKTNFRPYVGLGIIYSSFHHEKALGVLSGASFSLQKSLDPLFQVGFDYSLNDKISLNLDVRKLKTSSSAFATDLDKTIMGRHAPEKIDYSMGMQPLALSLNVSWLFDVPDKRRERGLNRVRPRQKRLLRLLNHT